jgi:hypothetical protein
LTFGWRFAILFLSTARRPAMEYFILIKNVGREPEYMKVFDDNGFRRKAKFPDWYSACEAVRIIDYMRGDSAYLGCDVVTESGGK